MWSGVVALFRDYMGTGLTVVWFMLSLAYLWVNEKEQHIRILFLYMPVILLLLYFNPLFASLVYGIIGEEVYYRLLWLLPVTVVIAYTCVSICGRIVGARPASLENNAQGAKAAAERGQSEAERSDHGFGSRGENGKERPARHFPGYRQDRSDHLRHLTTDKKIRFPGYRQDRSDRLRRLATDKKFRFPVFRRDRAARMDQMSKEQRRIRAAYRKRCFMGGTAAAAMACAVMVCGSYIYDDPNYVKAQNLTHVPDSVVLICDAIEVPGREVMAAFPLELVQYVRQYSPLVCMPYGREMLVPRPGWRHESPLCEAMESKEIDLEQLVPLTREAGCHFCILRSDKAILGDPQDYGWLAVGEAKGYVIYRDTEVELIIPGLE